MELSETKGHPTALRAEAREGGFTIIETVIALCIAMVVGFGAISLFLFAIGYNAGASDRARALALAQQRIEILRATPYANLKTVAAAMPTTETVGSSASPDYDQRTFNVTTTVADNPSVNPYQRIITVTVTPAKAGRWTGGSVTLRCYQSENKLGTN
jgi:Tfp pilus assembly protein PilV